MQRCYYCYFVRNRLMDMLLAGWLVMLYIFYDRFLLYAMLPCIKKETEEEEKKSTRCMKNANLSSPKLIADFLYLFFFSSFSFFAYEQQTNEKIKNKIFLITQYRYISVEVILSIRKQNFVLLTKYVIRNSKVSLIAFIMWVLSLRICLVVCCMYFAVDTLN